MVDREEELEVVARDLEIIAGLNQILQRHKAGPPETMRDILVRAVLDHDQGAIDFMKSLRHDGVVLTRIFEKYVPPELWWWRPARRR